MRLRAVGDDAVLVELDVLAEVHRLHHAVLAAGFARDSVPGWRTLLVSGAAPEVLAARLRDLPVGEVADQVPVRHEIAVLYDGGDLAGVAGACGLTPEEVVALHLAAEFTVAFLGFSRGFPYLAGLPPELDLPRRATPRTRVPAGSVAIAAGQCGIYPRASPGGWHLIGTVTRELFDPAADPPSALSPGDLVRFVAAA